MSELRSSRRVTCDKGHLLTGEGHKRGCSECQRERSRQWKRDNPEHHAELNRLSRLRNVEKVRAYDRERNKIRHAANPQAAVERGRQLRARKHGAVVEAVDVKELMAKFKGRCGICGRPIAKGKKFHVDHIVPLSAGGSHSMDNCQPAHPRCNFRKGNKVISIA